MLSRSSVKYIQSLYHKKFRDEEGLFVAEGPKVAAELLTGAAHLIRGIYAVKSWLNSNAFLLEQVPEEKILVVEQFELEKISALSTPNQVLVVAQKLTHDPAHKAGITLLLDDIQDPGNMGTIIRTADWFGVTNVVCSMSSADIYNPKVIQSTMGSILRVHTAYTDLEEWCKINSHIKLYATALNGQHLYACKPEPGMALLIGNESRGVRSELLGVAHKKITIPRKGKAESLNAAVATGIVLAHFVNTDIF